jgi:hypothetical protein
LVAQQLRTHLVAQQLQTHLVAQQLQTHLVAQQLRTRLVASRLPQPAAPSPSARQPPVYRLLPRLPRVRLSALVASRPVVSVLPLLVAASARCRLRA